MRNGDYILVKAPQGYSGKLYRGRYCYEHHAVWWTETGHAVTGKEIVHHKDGNKHNNSFSNLQLLDTTTHNKEHYSGRNMIQLKCPQCGTIFDREYRRVSARFAGKVSCCSRSCGQLFSRREHTEEELRVALSTNIIRTYRTPSS